MTAFLTSLGILLVVYAVDPALGRSAILARHGEVRDKVADGVRQAPTPAKHRVRRPLAPLAPFPPI